MADRSTRPERGAQCGDRRSRVILRNKLAEEFEARIVKAFALLAVLVSLAGAASPIMAATLSDQVRVVLLAVFQFIGTDENGMVRPRGANEMIRHTSSAILANQDGRVTLKEFKASSMGFESLAQGP